MSFGFSIGDCVLIVQLAFNVVESSRRACGEHDEFTREVASLHVVLQRLQDEASKPESLLNQANDGRLDELQSIVRNCKRLLKAVNTQLREYNGLGEGKKSFAKVWQSFRFGNFEMKRLSQVRTRISSYRENIIFYLNLICLGSQGRVERRMNALGGEMQEIRRELNGIAAAARGSGREGSILTTYKEDDKAAWKELRRELIKGGFSVSTLNKHRDIITNYLLELGARGVLDDPVIQTEAMQVKPQKKGETATPEGSYGSAKVADYLSQLDLTSRHPPDEPLLDSISKTTKFAPSSGTKFEYSLQDAARNEVVDRKSSRRSNNEDGGNIGRFTFTDPLELFEEFMRDYTGHNNEKQEHENPQDAAQDAAMNEVLTRKGSPRSNNEDGGNIGRFTFTDPLELFKEFMQDFTREKAQDRMQVPPQPYVEDVIDEAFLSRAGPNFEINNEMENEREKKYHDEPIQNTESVNGNWANDNAATMKEASTVADGRTEFTHSNFQPQVMTGDELESNDDDTGDGLEPEIDDTSNDLESENDDTGWCYLPSIETYYRVVDMDTGEIQNLTLRSPCLGVQICSGALSATDVAPELKLVLSGIATRLRDIQEMLPYERHPLTSTATAGKDMLRGLKLENPDNPDEVLIKIARSSLELSKGVPPRLAAANFILEVFREDGDFRVVKDFIAAADSWIELYDEGLQSVV